MPEPLRPIACQTLCPSNCIERLSAESASLSVRRRSAQAREPVAGLLASEPEVLILDEPTSGLDLFIRREFLASMVELAGAGRTILISSHGIAEVERVASHAGFMAEGRLLLAASIEELRKRLVRVRLRFAGLPPDPAELGRVLEFETTGRLWQAVLQDPKRSALEEMRQRPGIHNLQETPLNLEEMYTALLARFHRPEEAAGRSNGRATALRPSPSVLRHPFHNSSADGGSQPAESRINEEEQP